MGTIEYLVESTASQTLPERMQELYATGELMDTTLVCKNGSVRAHKVVMASQSKFLKDVLTQHPCKSPVIVLLDLDLDTLRCLVDYMYYGKVAIKASVLEDFIKAANVLRLMSVIRGLDHEDDVDQSESHGVTNQLVACCKNDTNSFEETVCHVEEVNNYVDHADATTGTSTATTTTVTDVAAPNSGNQVDGGEAMAGGQELVQVQSLEGHVPDSFVTDDMEMTIAASTSATPVTSSHSANQSSSTLRTIVISSRANFDQRPTHRLFSQRPTDRPRFGPTNHARRRRFDVVALRSRPSSASPATAGGVAEISSSGGSELVALPSPALTVGGASLGGGGAGNKPVGAAGGALISSRKCESLARIEAGLIGADQRDGGDANLNELVSVHQQMIVDSNGVRMHQCLLCPQTTAFPSNMKRHIMGHLGIKPFKCQFCDFQSTLRGDLNVHVRKKHSVDENRQNIIINMR